MRRIGLAVACLFLAACVLLGTAARFYLPVALAPWAALAIAALAGVAAGGMAPRALAPGIAWAALAAPAWALFGFWLAASGQGRQALPSLSYPLAASAGVAAGLAAWRWRASPRALRAAPLAAAAALVVALAFSFGALTRAAAPGPHRVPAFTLPLVAGGTLDSRAFAGKTVVLAFWATWCRPCRKELPALQRLRRRYANDSGVVFYLVDVGLAGETPVKARRFLSERAISIPSAYDAGGRFAARLGTHGAVPARFVIGPHGMVRYRALGYAGEPGFPALRRAIAAARRSAPESR